MGLFEFQRNPHLFAPFVLFVVLVVHKKIQAAAEVAPPFSHCLTIR
jgi:hypothetical protein